MIDRHRYRDHNSADVLSAISFFLFFFCARAVIIHLLEIKIPKMRKMEKRKNLDDKIFLHSDIHPASIRSIISIIMDYKRIRDTRLGLRVSRTVSNCNVERGSESRER